ncbi:SRPBCC family protein [Streptomyces sp. NPDC056549]|uniref:SRPBCC family protein n=1 Tax=Streptomyces sp. NPDC056549 TaxID=3345864 RepID=UPI00369C85F1
MVITVKRDILVGVPLGDLIAYMEDFSRAEEWDPGTVRCVRVGAGPVRQGAEWRNTSRFRGRTSDLLYRLESREPGRLVFVGENKTVRATDDMTFTARSPTTTLLTYTASFRFKGLARLAAPFLRSELERLGDGVAERLPSVAGRQRG